MRISSKQVHDDENQGLILLQTAGTTRLQIDQAGNTTFSGAISGISGVSAVSAVLSGTNTIGGVVNIAGASDTLGFYGATAVAVQSSTAATAAQAFVGGGATAATSASKWSGNTGTKVYGVNEIVSALKAYGLLAS